jgi:hypothetical protein
MKPELSLAYRAMLKSPDGKRCLLDILACCGLYDPYASPAKQEIGVFIKSRLESSDPGAYYKLMQERKNYA